MLFLHFNSIKVRLEQGGSQRRAGRQPYFNSIKVRLEPRKNMAIRTCALFQFHKGTIRTAVSHLVIDPHVNFNSIKVRLEPCASCRDARKVSISIP